VNEWISSLDLFVLACKEDKNGDKDGIPVVLIEAMNLKIPVVSTNISALGELIENGYSGFLGEPNNVDSIKSCIEKVIHLQESEKEKILENAKQKIIKEFDLYVNTKRLTENFHE
jgi:glycosyltransferase involved in cell wall biosynthesis